MSSNISSLADPSTLAPYDHEGVLQVVIETPKDSRNKYAYDHERRVIALKKSLPAGMLFPYDFGFVPSTLAEDLDPIDVLLLMDAPTFPGCVVEARLIGVIEGEDELAGGRTQRNDRLLAVALASHSFENIRKPADIPKPMLVHMQEFFVTYPRLLSGKTYKVIGIKGAAVAKGLIQEAIRRNRLEPTRRS